MDQMHHHHSPSTEPEEENLHPMEHEHSHKHSHAAPMDGHDHAIHGVSTPASTPPTRTHSEHEMHTHTEGMSHEGEHAGAHADHTGHENLFRRKFWVSLLLTIPVLLCSQGFQTLLDFSMPKFPGSQCLAPVFGIIVFFYGGLPFIRMAVPEIKNRQPGMMTLISLAISVAFIYSTATLFLPDQMDFFWELVTLIDIMLLGHWIEMLSVRQVSGALNALAKLMPDTAECIGADGSVVKGN